MIGVAKNRTIRTIPSSSRMSRMKTAAAGRSSTGKTTLVIRFAFSRRQPTDRERASEKRSQGRSPERKKREKRSVPVSSMLTLTRKTREKTNKYTAMVDSGFITAHKMPAAEPANRPLISLTTNSLRSKRYIATENAGLAIDNNISSILMGNFDIRGGRNKTYPAL